MPFVFASFVLIQSTVTNPIGFVPHKMNVQIVFFKATDPALKSSLGGCLTTVIFTSFAEKNYQESPSCTLAERTRSSGDFDIQAGPFGNRNMGGKAEQFRAMGAIPVEFKNGRIFGLHALLEAGKGEPLIGGIESIGTHGKVAV